MDKVGRAGAGGARMLDAGAQASVAASQRAQHDAPPNPDTGVLFLGDAPPLPAPVPRADGLAPFARLLGARLGPDSPAWGQDALGLLRGLQKRLIGHALTLAQPARRPCLDAVGVLESAVGLRLRILQMQMAETISTDAPARD